MSKEEMSERSPNSEDSPAPRSVAAVWRESLEAEGYEREIRTARDVRRLMRLSRAWRAILAATGLRSGARVLEVGCGGGKQLVPLALRGFRCVGVDYSPEVLLRCDRLAASSAALTGKGVQIELACADFLEYDTESRFDLVFNFGVVEHFLDDGQRAAFLEKCFELCTPAGWVVSVVPSGGHPLRDRMRAEKLGGYDIPEVDYTVESMRAELGQAGGADVTVIANNMFGYLLIDPRVSKPRHLANQGLFLAAQAVPRRRSPYFYRHAMSLIGVARAS